MGMGWRIVKEGNRFRVVSYKTGAGTNRFGGNVDSMETSQSRKQNRALANSELNTPDEPKQRTGGLLG